MSGQLSQLARSRVCQTRSFAWTALQSVVLLLVVHSSGPRSFGCFAFQAKQVTHSPQQSRYSSTIIVHNRRETQRLFVKKNGPSPSETNQDAYYSDDCFGLIFLSTALLPDPAFSFTFLSLSTAAAVAQRSPRRPQIVTPPAAVAAATLGLSPLLAKAVEWSPLSARYAQLQSMYQQNDMDHDSVFLAQFVVCSVSIVYGLYTEYQKRREQ